MLVYLREKEISEEFLPTIQPDLLQETRIQWIQVQHHAEATLNKIRDIVNEGVYKAEEGLGRIWSILAGTRDKAKEHAGP
ncbi:hypothetical protein F5887DRAFT_1072378 [Amanita rubescens]|nr:hypothetical protein F5887DRAFT_1072378 [Amanita rubescens]